MEGLATGVADEWLVPVAAPAATARGWGVAALESAASDGMSNEVWHLGQIPRLPARKAFNFMEWPQAGHFARMPISVSVGFANAVVGALLGAPCRC